MKQTNSRRPVWRVLLAVLLIAAVVIVLGPRLRDALLVGAPETQADVASAWAEAVGTDETSTGLVLLPDSSPQSSTEDTIFTESTASPATSAPFVPAAPETEPAIDENGSYTERDDVALYLWTYHKLPANFITKSAAQKLGWSGGGLEAYAPGCAIGGDRFGNNEGLLPAGKKYRECDVGTVGAKSRGARRIVYAEDFSAIYYTDDHYESFTQLYGAEQP